MKRTIVMMVFLLVLICGHLWADEIFLNDGARFEGLIISEDSESMLVKTKQGSVTIVKANVSHVERWDAEANKVFRSDPMKNIKSFFTQSPDEMWRILKQKIWHTHIFIFHQLERVPIFQWASSKKAVKELRKLSYPYYCFLVYFSMIFLLIVGFSICKSLILAIIRRLLGIRQRYDM